MRVAAVNRDWNVGDENIPLGLFWVAIICKLFIKGKKNLGLCNWTGPPPSKCVPNVHTVEIKEALKDDKTDFYNHCRLNFF